MRDRYLPFATLSKGLIMLPKMFTIAKSENSQDVETYGISLACVAWRFCRAGRRSGVAGKFAREACENERRSREKNKNRLPGFVAFSTAAPFNSF